MNTNYDPSIRRSNHYTILETNQKNIGSASSIEHNLQPPQTKDEMITFIEKTIDLIKAKRNAQTYRNEDSEEIRKRLDLISEGMKQIPFSNVIKASCEEHISFADLAFMSEFESDAGELESDEATKDEEHPSELESDTNPIEEKKVDGHLQDLLKEVKKAPLTWQSQVVTFFSKETLKSNLDVIKNNLRFPAIRENINEVNNLVEGFFKQVEDSTSLSRDGDFKVSIFSSEAPVALGRFIVRELKIKNPEGSDGKLSKGDKLKNFGTGVLAGVVGRVYFAAVAPFQVIKHLILVPFKVSQAVADGVENGWRGSAQFIPAIDQDQAIFGKSLYTSGIFKTAFSIAKAIAKPLEAAANSAITWTIGFEAIMKTTQNSSYEETIDKVMKFVRSSYIITGSD